VPLNGLVFEAKKMFPNIRLPLHNNWTNPATEFVGSSANFLKKTDAKCRQMHGSSLEIPTAGDINLTITVLEASSSHRLDPVVAKRKLLVVATIHVPRNHIAARKTARDVQRISVRISDGKVPVIGP
jgi:hypothetical protein